MNVINQKVTDTFSIYNGDCVDVVGGMPDSSVHYSIFSPPFASLYTYSNSPHDMGNVRNDAEFFAQFAYLAKELYRVTKPGRLLSFHSMMMPTSKTRDGFIGVRDFRGDLIRAFQAVGFYLHSEVTIWKDPVTAMQRTKALGLLHKQIKKDSAMSRQGLADYLTTMRKPGDNSEPVTHTNESFPVRMWQRYASPVWVTTGDREDGGFLECLGNTETNNESSTVNPSDTLQFRSAREHDDERHICPLQLQVIERAMRLWTNPGDVVLSPFAGIGSEGYVAIREKRKFVGAELKKSYYDTAVRNLTEASTLRQEALFT